MPALRRAAFIGPSTTWRTRATMNIPVTLKLRVTLAIMLTAAGLFVFGFAHGYGLELIMCPNECEGE
jgi:hypothetical protein